MKTKLALISLIQLFLLHSSISVQLGHEVGSTSMDSTHYDRRIIHQQCSLNNNDVKDLNRASFWATIRSPSPSTVNSTNQTQLVPFRRQLIINNGEDRLVTRSPSSNTTNTNQTTLLGIDQATVDIIVDNQVELSLLSQIMHGTSVFFRSLAI